MAAAFKTATVNASDVPSTQTNFPSYVDLSRLGITTLAEAQSVRVYADSAKTTEWAREIVSASEMHVKIPSLTTTTDIYVDYDGVRADYAVTDTYGRNAVWTGYKGVLHFTDNSNDSSGSVTPSPNNITYTTGKLGKASSYNATSSVIYTNIAESAGSFSTSFWFKSNYAGTSLSGATSLSSSQSGTSSIQTYIYLEGTNDFVKWEGSGANLINSTDIIDNTWHKVTIVNDVSGTTAYLYVDGSFVASQTNITSISGWWRIGQLSGATNFWYDGEIDEYRTLSSALSSDWITTEYNNQSDEPSFWGTWSDVGGGFTATPLMHMMQIAGGLI